MAKPLRSNHEVGMRGIGELLERLVVGEREVVVDGA